MVGYIFDLPGVTQDQYYQVQHEVMPGNRPPAGQLFHAAGPTADGWRVIEIWEAQEPAERFYQHTLAPVAQRANITPQPQRFEVVNTVHP
jgi:hypothetical protein